MQLFLQEIQIMSKLRHPYIVTYYGCAMDLEKIQISIVMELLPQSLSDLIKKELIPLPLFLKITRGVANGLLYLHRVANVIHRDIKPSNILLTSSHEPRILDFGISKPNTAMATMTEIGTPEVM